MANRLQIVLPNIIHLDQQGYIKGRNIAFNIRQIQDIIDHAEKLDLEGAIMFLDFKQAFDTVNREFMLDTLHTFGFNDNFITWVKVIYNGICARIMNNGWKSERIDLHRGVHYQHCCSLW